MGHSDLATGAQVEKIATTLSHACPLTIALTSPMPVRELA